MLEGDFWWVLPVVPHGSFASVCENCLKTMPTWRHFKIVKHNHNMRTMNGAGEFAGCLKRM